jgi:hypothetical protein
MRRGAQPPLAFLRIERDHRARAAFCAQGTSDKSMLMHRFEQPARDTGTKAVGTWLSRPPKAVIKRVCLRVAAVLLMGGASACVIALKTARAIYTRKSTEEGLEQAFNSLDAQREACTASL